MGSIPTAPTNRTMMQLIDILGADYVFLSDEGKQVSFSKLTLLSWKDAKLNQDEVIVSDAKFQTPTGEVTFDRVSVPTLIMEDALGMFNG